MYRVVVDECAKFRAFLSIVDVGSIDVLLSKDTAVFVLNSNEVFAKFIARSSRALADKDLEFRVSRSLVASLFKDGAIEISDLDGEIQLVFYSAAGKMTCGVTVQHQTVFRSMFDFKEKALAEAAPTPFDSEPLKRMSRLAQNTGGFLNVSDGVASVVTKGNARVYLPVSIDASFALTPKAFSFLRKCSGYFYQIQEYVCAVTQGFVVMVTTVRVNSNREYQALCGSNSVYRSRYVANVNFTNLISFLMYRKVDAVSVSIDMHTRAVQIETASARYAVPVEFTDERCGEGYSFDSITIPMYVLKQIITVAGSEFVLKKKDEFILLQDKSGMVVIFS